MKNQITQLLLIVIAIVGISLLMSSTRPAADVAREYMLIKSGGDDKDAFAASVNSKIAEGWHPQGGITQMKNGFCQAMVR